jgi:hypothetical protein
LKEILDKITDLCENSAILNQSKLAQLKEYLDGHQNFIACNFLDDTKKLK